MKPNRLLVIVVLVSVLVVVLIGVAVAGTNQQRSFKATSFEWVTEEGNLEGSDCPADTVFIEGNGNGTHLGEFTVVRRHCFTPPNHPDFAGDVIHDGTYEITAANGDKIWGMYTGSLEPTEFGDMGPIRGIITSPSTIGGGTGRFEGAQGDYLTVGDYDLLADEGNFEMEGWISY